MSEPYIWFDKKDENWAVDLAKYLAQLIREGVTYSIRQDNTSVEVRLTGGF